MLNHHTGMRDRTLPLAGRQIGYGVPFAQVAHRRAGFTLLELMLVVAVLALLMAILIPSLQRARARTRQLVCQANLRQIGQGWSIYLQDAKGAFLQAKAAKYNWYTNYGGRQGSRSTYQIDKPLNRSLRLPLKTEDALVFRCPLDTGSPAILPSNYERYGTSYRMNHLLVGQGRLLVTPGDPCAAAMRKFSDRLWGINASDIRSTSLMLLAGDYGWYNAWRYTFPSNQHIDWHSRPGHYNFLFLDGHVSYLKMRKGMNVTGHYSIIPFDDLKSEIAECQVEIDYE